jgi:hypothetical protein
MRSVLGWFLLSFLVVTPAWAETRVFIVKDDDGYGVNRCLAAGASCGAAIASAYCRSHAFREARWFRKVAEAGMNDAASAIPECGGNCSAAIAIECTR